MTSPGKQGQMADVNGHVSLQCFNRARTRPGPLGMEDSVNSKDMGKPN